MDVDDGMFPVAFAIVSGENHSDWTWFLEQLNMALDNTGQIVFVSDRHQSIIDGVRFVFGDVHHAFCLRHLKANFKKNLRKPMSAILKNVLEVLLTDAAYARATLDFNNHMGDIRGISEDAYIWLMTTRPENWANCLFPGNRYDKLTSNYAETYNAWILKQRELPIMQLLNSIRMKQMEMMYKRKQKLIKWKYDVGPKINKILKKRVRKSEGLTVRRSSMSGFEVEGDASTHSVDLSLRSCSCKAWEMTGLPSIHASAAIIQDSWTTPELCFT
ncbi:uncharacterized protein LOC122082144 [Macadamia integrifolia]|uniref:uncharacterized protein LOC122082144 n=1 Tax=Macadamia integrifolia TaxID=60698 RepID=UPI001C4EC1F2|nr:uncharacterized protein LOC122082144 [Macadamia integrifolia]